MIAVIKLSWGAINLTVTEMNDLSWEVSLVKLMFHPFDLLSYNTILHELTNALIYWREHEWIISSKFCGIKQWEQKSEKYFSSKNKEMIEFPWFHDTYESSFRIFYKKYMPYHHLLILENWWRQMNNKWTYKTIQ